MACLCYFVQLTLFISQAFVISIFLYRLNNPIFRSSVGHFLTHRHLNLSTTVEQAVGCAPVTQRARVRSRGQFLGWVFFGVFPHLYDKCQEALGPQGPRISFGPHNHPFIFALLKNGFVNGVFFQVLLSRRWPRHWAVHSSGEALHVLVWSKKDVCDPELIPSPNRSWLCKARCRESCKGTYKGEVKPR